MLDAAIHALEEEVNAVATQFQDPDFEAAIQHSIAIMHRFQQLHAPLPQCSEVD